MPRTALFFLFAVVRFQKEKQSMDKNSLINLFFESKKNSNCILELEKDLLSDDVENTRSSLALLQELYEEVFKRNLFKIDPESDTNEEKYTTWLTGRYNDYIQHLLGFLNHGDDNIQAKALEILMSFLVLEGTHPMKTVPDGVWYFPKEFFEKIVSVMTAVDIDQQELILKFENYTSYDDVKLYLLKGLSKRMNENEQITDLFLMNCFLLLNSIKYPKEALLSDGVTNTLLLSQNNSTAPFQLKEKVFSKLFSTTWINFLKFQLPHPLLKRVLVILHKRVVPFLQNPCLLTDFLTDAYHRGGLLSLLALNGLFYLMDRHNVEYPDFFQKLYSLFDVGIVNGKFSARFFFLSDLFLSSTHLPAYLVAAFLKRLCRISLHSSTPVILKILPFVYNMLIRHPTLTVLVHRPQTDVSEDPFDFDAQNPADSKAIDSSLWEIKTLQSHVNPDVAKKAKLINYELPTTEFDLADILDESFESIYTKERKRKFLDVPAAVCKNPKLDNWFTLKSVAVEI